MNPSRTPRIIALFASACMSMAVMVTVLALFDISLFAEAMASLGQAPSRVA